MEEVEVITAFVPIAPLKPPPSTVEHHGQFGLFLIFVIASASSSFARNSLVLVSELPKSIFSIFGWERALSGFVPSNSTPNPDGLRVNVVCELNPHAVKISTANIAVTSIFLNMISIRSINISCHSQLQYPYSK